MVHGAAIIAAIPWKATLNASAQAMSDRTVRSVYYDSRPGYRKFLLGVRPTDCLEVRAPSDPLGRRIRVDHLVLDAHASQVPMQPEAVPAHRRLAMPRIVTKPSGRLLSLWVENAVRG